MGEVGVCAVVWLALGEGGGRGADAAPPFREVLSCPVCPRWCSSLLAGQGWASADQAPAWHGFQQSGREEKEDVGVGEILQGWT